MNDAALFDALVPAVRAAGAAIMQARATGHRIETKADFTPVTEADTAAETILLAALARLAPGVPIVAEEEVAAGRIPAVLTGPFFLVDALDGTKDFIAGGPDFTVNIGLVRDGDAVAGIVHAPATGMLWTGIVGAGAYRQGPDGIAAPIRVRTPPAIGIDIVASKSHRNAETDAFIARFPGSRVVAAGSSLKLVVIAEGSADLYPRLGPTSQWDIAAGDAILRAAGGRVVTMDGRALPYGPLPSPTGAAAYLNPWFVATGGIDPFG